MAVKKEETASFVLRFTQKIYQNEQGESQVQWRGHIRHVQGDDERRFSAFEEALEFVQEKLADLTLQAVEDKSPEEQKGILAKSFDLWKKMAAITPQLVMESIKDPKKQVAQIQEQMHQASELVNQRIEEAIAQRMERIDEWRNASKSDIKSMAKMMEKITEDLAALHAKVDAIAGKKSK